MSYNAKVYMTQGGAEQVIASTGVQTVESGGKIAVESGGELELQSGAVLDDQRFSGGTTSAADALAIPVTHRYVAKTTGADAEALTLADGVAGQMLTIALVVDGGGDGTLTPATCSGFATIVFADAGDNATLIYIDDTSGWVIVGAAGVTAPPVISV